MKIESVVKEDIGKIFGLQLNKIVQKGVFSSFFENTPFFGDVTPFRSYSLFLGKYSFHGSIFWKSSF